MGREASSEIHVIVDAGMVNVKVRHGIVTLAGNVPDRRACEIALNTAKHTLGVIDVVNDLTIG